jgi:hypothetical protein
VVGLGWRNGESCGDGVEAGDVMGQWPRPRTRRLHTSISFGTYMPCTCTYALKAW